MAAHVLLSVSSESALAAPGISGGEKGAVGVVGLIAIAALAFAYALVREVLAADQGTAKMQEIGKAVQEAPPPT